VYYPTGAITSFDLSALTLLTLNVT